MDQASQTSADLGSMLELQRDAHRRESVPGFAQRRRDLLSLKRFLTENSDAITEAICSDYGNRSHQETQLAEFIPALDGINHALANLRSWMKTRRRPVDGMLFPGGRNRVFPQPLGVVGLIMPWNFPINLAFLQLTSAFAAGNRAMVKMSENSIALTRLLQELSSSYFPREKLVFIEETGGVGIEFSKLPLDLIIFTGSGPTGRAVMKSASANLTPVILELGGKSPAIIGRDFPMEKAVERIMFAKQLNAGQICTSVDYVFVPSDEKARFVELTEAWVQEHVPDILGPGYTSIIDDRSYQRLVDTLTDAREKGARVLNLCGEQEPDAGRRKLPLYLVLDTSEDMIIRQRETFGPILMVFTYTEPDEVIAHVRSHDTPLALYPFSNDERLIQRYIDALPSGGVTVNDCLMHVGQHDLPFGGLGPSGMGHYHGREGFEACSKMRPVFYQGRFSLTRVLAPPYRKLATRVLETLFRLKR